jgi:CheY-like chemotaxis protein
MGRAETAVDCVRLSEPLRQQLLRDLEEQAESRADAGAAHRRFERHLFHGRHVTLTLHGRHGEQQRYLTCSRNLSATGISVIHGGFIYDGTACTITLPTLTGELDNLRGRVVRCRLVRGALHELGISFDGPIDPRCFVSGYVPTSSELEATDVDAPVRGRILLLDDQEAEALLLRHHLSGTEATLEICDTSDEALRALDERPIDAFICDLNLAPDDADGVDVIRRARDMGYGGPIVALTGPRSASELVRCKELGAADVLLKPYSPTKLLESLSRLTSDVASLGPDGPLRSTMSNAGAPETIKLLEEYVGAVRRQMDSLLESVANEAVDAVRETCRTLEETGAGFGYAPLSESARRLRERLESTGSAAESRQEVLRLRELVDRMEAGPQHG